MALPEFPSMTDAQSIRFMLSLPWAMGENTEDGEVEYSAGEIETILRFVDSLNARAEAAEDKVARLLEALSITTGQRDGSRAEVARLRKQVATLRSVLRRMDWLEGGDEISASDAAAIKAALEATA